MSWFAYPLVILPLYGVPSVLVIGETNVQWMKWVSGYSIFLFFSSDCMYCTRSFVWSTLSVLSKAYGGISTV